MMTIYLDANKSLPLVFLPLGISLLLLAAGLTCRRWLLIAMPMVILGSLGTPAVADLLMRSLEDQYPYRTVAECPRADAVFVFGGIVGVRNYADEGIAWNQAAKRFDRAVRLMNADKARMLVLSGGPEGYEGGPDEGELLKKEAVALGVPGEAVLVTESTMNTKDEAKILCQLATLQHWAKVLIVTSAFHMPRVMQLSKECSAQRISVPVAYETPDPGTTWAYKRLDYYIPQAGALAVSERALREYLGMLFYGVVGLVQR